MSFENNLALVMAPVLERKTYRLGELFAGAGGMALGAHNAKFNGNGFTQAWVNDMNHDACKTLKDNLPIPEGGSYYCRVEDLDFDSMADIDGALKRLKLRSHLFS